MTLRGAYDMGQVAADGTHIFTVGISFGIALGAAPTPHLISKGSTDLPAACQGTAATPEAQAGHLCVYERDNTNTDFLSVFDPVAPRAAAASKYGFGMSMSAAVAGFYASRGSWAVTAP